MNEQTVFTLNQAAKASGRSKGTISKALASGKLSYLSKDDGGYRIDAAELFRVFPAKPGASGSGVQLETPDKPSGNSVLQREIELLRERLEDKDRIIEDLKQDREHWRQQATALLPDRRPWLERLADLFKKREAP